MEKIGLVLLTLLLLVSSVSANQDTAPEKIRGSLVITGGRLEPDNREVYEKFIELAMRNRHKSRQEINIGILPTAGAHPMESFKAFKDSLLPYGIPEKNIRLIPIAVKDDKETPLVDESAWKLNAHSKEVVKIIETCDAIWFQGGDQSKYTAALYDQYGNRTPVLKAIWDIYAKGAVLGGTSAGAAIMSDPMIGGGDSFTALQGGVVKSHDQSRKGVYLTRGLGFFKFGIVDQHFSQRGRLGRLIVAAWNAGSKQAFGVDENTSMIVDHRQNTIQVIGENGLTIVDISKAKQEPGKSTFALADILLSYIEKGDIFNLNTGRFELRERTPRKGNDNEEQRPLSASIFEQIKETITGRLLDANVQEAKGFLFNVQSENTGTGFMVKFRKGADTIVTAGTLKERNIDTAAAVNVHMDIVPVVLKITEE